jgi:hypothetical protein
MKKYTLEPIQSEDVSASPSRYRLYVDGEPTVIAVSGDEAAQLCPKGPNIKRHALETLFKCSPTRKERLARVPR